MSQAFLLRAYMMDGSLLAEKRFGALPIRIGRNDLNDFQINQHLISNFHARIEPADDKIWVRDLGSKNGVFVRVGSSSTRIEAPADLAACNFEFYLGPQIRIRLETVDAIAREPSPRDGSVLGNLQMLAGHSPRGTGDAPLPHQEDLKSRRLQIPPGESPMSPRQHSSESGALPSLPPLPAAGTDPAPAVAPPSPYGPPPGYGSPSGQPLPHGHPPSLSGPSGPSVSGPGSPYGAPPPVPSPYGPPPQGASPYGPPPQGASPYGPPPHVPPPYNPSSPAGSSSYGPPPQSPPLPSLNPPEGASVAGSLGYPAPPNLPPLGHPSSSGSQGGLDAPGQAPGAWAPAPNLPQASGPRPGAMLNTGYFSGMALEVLALQGLKELASSLVPGKELNSSGDLARFITKLHDALDVFCRCFIPLREGYAQFVSSLDLQKAAMQRSMHRSRGYMAVEMAKDAETVAAALLDWTEGSLDAHKAIEGIYADLMIHQVALLDGVMQGVRSLLDELSPENIENNLGHGKLGLGLSNRYKALWQAYCERFDELSEEKQAFSHIFGHEFTDAYREYRRRKQTGETP